MTDEIKYDYHRLKEWRNHAGLTQEEVAAALNLTGAHVSRVETGMRDWDRKYLQRFKDLINETLDSKGLNGVRVSHVSELLSCDPKPYSLVVQSVIVQHLWEQCMGSMANALGVSETDKTYPLGPSAQPPE